MYRRSLSGSNRFHTPPPVPPTRRLAAQVRVASPARLPRRPASRASRAAPPAPPWLYDPAGCAVCDLCWWSERRDSCVRSHKYLHLSRSSGGVMQHKTSGAPRGPHYVRNGVVKRSHAGRKRPRAVLCSAEETSWSSDGRGLWQRTLPGGGHCRTGHHDVLSVATHIAGGILNRVKTQKTNPVGPDPWWR